MTALTLSSSGPLMARCCRFRFPETKPQSSGTSRSGCRTVCSCRTRPPATCLGRPVMEHRHDAEAEAASSTRRSAGDVVFRHACKLGFESIVSKRLGSALARLAQHEEPGGTARCAGRGRLGQENVSMRSLVGIIAAAVIATTSRAASRCACKKAEAPRRRPDATGVALADGRTLGPDRRPADLIIFNMTGLGRPTLPYCH